MPLCVTVYISLVCTGWCTHQYTLTVSIAKQRKGKMSLSQTQYQEGVRDPFFNLEKK